MGESARQPGSPKLAATPMELLTLRPGEGFSVFDRLVHPVVGGIIGLSSVALYNHFNRRPYYAGIQNYVFVSLGCVYLAMLYRDSRFAARSENDAVLKHYISLHPEEFPPIERKRFKEVFLPWHPAR